jgi:tetratricopeptide (TPR) repeat protein
MNQRLAQIGAMGRQALEAGDLGRAQACAQELLRQDGGGAEGYFLSGLLEKVQQRPVKAAQAFERALELDERRYDAAVELANQHMMARRYGQAQALLARYEDTLHNSPRYLDMAGTIYSNIGMPERAWPLYVRANELQPELELFRANKAACAVFVGKIDEARTLYQGLLAGRPTHQRNHYQLSRLEKVRDTRHIEQMEQVLEANPQSPDKNIFMYYALGKEYEDLERWDEAFAYYKAAGDAVASVANYDIRDDEQLIQTIIETCDRDWLERDAGTATPGARTPIFIVGLPRTGTTLTERILSSHSRVQSVDETHFLEWALARASGMAAVRGINSAVIEAAARTDMAQVASGFMEMVEYRLGPQPLFIEKFTYNYLYLGFIAKAWPEARIIHLRRHPLDACFAMYKQPYFPFAFTLDDLGRYYLAYDRLMQHWRGLLGERLIEVSYEELVSDQEAQTRRLLDRLGLEFEQACLDFEKNKAASATASSVQVREKIHTRSVNRWTHFSSQLQPLKRRLEQAGIKI